MNRDEPGLRTLPGTYALLLRAETEQCVDVGALGTLHLQPGVYVYVGSAFGPEGVRARVKRHVRDDGARHWHVDYVRAVTRLAAVWYTHDADRRECTWAGVLCQMEDSPVPLEGVGASDCTCATHIVGFEDRPRISAFRRWVRAACPEHAPLFEVDPAQLLA